MEEFPLNLNGKVGIVTGAGRGIGRAIAIGLAQAGARLTLASRTEAELHKVAEELREGGSQVITEKCDVSNPMSVEHLVEETISQYGRIDALVNNAGVLGPVGFLEQNDLDGWHLALKVNLYGAFLCCRYTLPVMKAQRSGKIINISGAGAPSPYPRFSAYNASKAGILGLTQTLAEETKEFGIEVNSVAPGITNTRMQEDILSSGESAGASYKRAKEVMEKGGVDPVKAADLVVFLCSEASNGISGRFFSARWDDWHVLRDKTKLESFIQSEMYTVRRIDGVFFDRVANSRKK